MVNEMKGEQLLNGVMVTIIMIQNETNQKHCSLCIGNSPMYHNKNHLL